MFDEFESFMAFNHELLEEKIEECLEAARNGETSIDIDANGLNDDDIAYIQNEVKRRIENGDY